MVPEHPRAEFRLARVASTIERWTSRRSVVGLTLALAFVSLVKSGVGVFESPLWPLSAWPRPVEAYPPLTYGFRVIAQALNTESRTVYTLIAFAVILVALVAMGLSWRHSLPPREARWVAILIAGGPAMWVVWGGIGRTDIYIILSGVFLGTLGRSIPWAILAALLGILGNPEQAVVLGVGLFILSLTSRFSPWRRGAIAYVGISGVAWLTLTLWSRSLGIPGRVEYFQELWRQSLQWFFIQLPLELYAGFGLTLVAICWAVVDQRARDAVLVIAGTLVLPLIVTALTLDQSRVLVACSIGSVSAILTIYAPRIVSQICARTRFPLALTLVTVILLPAVEITANVIRVPWGFFYPYFQAYVLTPLL